MFWDIKTCLSRASKIRHLLQCTWSFGKSFSYLAFTEFSSNLPRQLSKLNKAQRPRIARKNFKVTEGKKKKKKEEWSSFLPNSRWSFCCVKKQRYNCLKTSIPPDGISLPKVGLSLFAKSSQAIPPLSEHRVPSTIGFTFKTT